MKILLDTLLKPQEVVRILENSGFVELNKMPQIIGLGIQDLLADKRAQILTIADRHGAYNVRVFGSVARGEANADSDVDFLIDYQLERITPWFPAGLMLDLEALLHRKVDVATVDMLKERMRERILQEAVAL
jgi:uncharacterized protein